MVHIKKKLKKKKDEGPKLAGGYGAILAFSGVTLGLIAQRL